MKQCPYCAEEIQDAAVKCRYCGEFIKDCAKKTKIPWYFKNSFVIFSCFSVGPLALPLIWCHPSYSLFKKIVITGVMIALTYFLGAAMINIFKTLSAYYRQIAQVAF